MGPKRLTTPYGSTHEKAPCQASIRGQNNNGGAARLVGFGLGRISQTCLHDRFIYTLNQPLKTKWFWPIQCTEGRRGSLYFSLYSNNRTAQKRMFQEKNKFCSAVFTKQPLYH